MPMVGIFAKAHIADDQQVGRGRFDGADGAGDDAVVMEIIAAERIFFRRDAKQNHRRDAQLGDFARFVRQQVDGELRLPRHGSDGDAQILAMTNEKRIDKVGGLQNRLAHQAADSWGQAQAARTVDQAHQVSQCTISSKRLRPPAWSGLAAASASAGYPKEMTRRVCISTGMPSSSRAASGS